MAKTRIKTTPTRMQKEALMASAAVTTTTNIVTDNDLEKRIRVLESSITARKKKLPIQSTIIVQPPKRTNSISSTTSTISHTSDGTYSCTDSPPPPPPSSTTDATVAQMTTEPTMDELTESAIKALNAGLLAKSNARALKNRKVYMITEKCDDAAMAAINKNDNSGICSANNMAAAGQKRKIFLIMEENGNEKNQSGGDHAEKQMKVENTNGSKKLTLYTDTSTGQLPEEFEKVLPEILNRIQSKKGVKKIPLDYGNENGKNEYIVTPPEPKPQISLLKSHNNSNLQLKPENSERLPLTLPPKKNRTKIITTQIIPVNPSQHAIYPANGLENWPVSNSGVVVTAAATPSLVTTNISNGFYAKEKSCGATPVIVNASSLMAATKVNSNTLSYSNGLKSKENSHNNNNSTTTANPLHKNINLSTDFLFLMKMLPRLESIQDHHKSYVKTCIEDIINQYAPLEMEEK